MTLFSCARCHRPLTADLHEVPLPPPVTQDEPGDLFLPPRVSRGAFAVGTETDGFVLHPEDIMGTSLHPDRSRLAGCCRLDGLDGPNLVCDGCGAEVATRQSDCWSQQQVVLVPDGVDGDGKCPPPNPRHFGGA